jgi:hypothetical protein
MGLRGPRTDRKPYMRQDGAWCIDLANDKGTVLIDEADVQIVASYSWCANRIRTGNVVYAMARVNGKNVTMHRLLMGMPDLHVNHKNHDGLDNRRANLELVSHGDNMRHARKRGQNEHGMYAGKPATWCRTCRRLMTEASA